MEEQLSFDLPALPALGREAFFVSPSNALALALLDQPGNWPNGKMALIGEPGSGKTHLTSVWAAQTGARVIAAADLPGSDIAALVQGPIAVEDIDTIAGQLEAETALFHLHNLAAAERHALLVSARLAPQQIAFALPDLASRLQAAQIATLEAPDDALLAAVLMKLFADRQINPAPGLVPFLVRRIDRSFAAAQALVEQLDRAALAEGKPMTRALASAVLNAQSD